MELINFGQIFHLMYAMNMAKNFMNIVKKKKQPFLTLIFCLYFLAKKSLTNKLNCSSSKIDDVLNAYFHAIASHFPKKRYQIGTDCIFGFIPFSFLSADLQDWLFWLIEKIEKVPKLKQFDY